MKIDLYQPDDVRPVNPGQPDPAAARLLAVLGVLALLTAWGLAVVCVLCFAMAVMGAPAPAPKAAKPAPAPTLAGRWLMEWGGSTGPADFNPDGSYWSFWRGQTWNGRWHHDAGAKTLSVEEWPAGSEARPSAWTVTLTGPRQGTLAGGSRFALADPK